jgi:hypothetical protein
MLVYIFCGHLLDMCATGLGSGYDSTSTAYILSKLAWIAYMAGFEIISSADLDVNAYFINTMNSGGFHSANTAAWGCGNATANTPSSFRGHEQEVGRISLQQRQAMDQLDAERERGSGWTVEHRARGAMLSQSSKTCR